ncbi:MAG: IS4 family transposase, partial [Pyrinomonadaceae bacterium]
MKYPQFSQMSLEIQQLFVTVATQTAKLTRWVKRRSKLTGPLFFQTLILGWMDQPQASLNDLARVCRKMNPKVHVSPQALDQRINPAAVEFFRRMLAESLLHLKQQYPLEIELLKAFHPIYLLDSTSLSLPESLQEVFPGYGGGASAAGLKVQLLLEFLTGQYRLLEVKPGTAPDQNYGPQVLSVLQPNSLTLMDTGYFNAPFFRDLEERGAYFLSRLPANVSVFESLADEKGKSIDLDCLLAQAPATVFE